MNKKTRIMAILLAGVMLLSLLASMVLPYIG